MSTAPRKPEPHPGLLNRTNRVHFHGGPLDGEHAHLTDDLWAADDIDMHHGGRYLTALGDRTIRHWSTQ